METGLKKNTASRRKTGIYSGSFNPVHIGHLALANWLCEFTELDELWFLITPHNPLKEKEELMDDQLRYELVKKSIAGYPKFHASDFEFSLPKPTYTIRTLRTLEASYPAVNSISSWVQTIGKYYPVGRIRSHHFQLSDLHLSAQRIRC